MRAQFRAACPAALLAVCLALAACGPAQTENTQTESTRPEPAAPHPGGGMAAAAHPLAVEAGLEILRAGGGAVDAAVAVQAALTLVEPQSSGLGGGAFLIHYSAATGDVTAYDGRETAPAGAGPDLFLDEDGAPLGFLDAWTSGRAAGVPGVVAMLGLAHADHGRLGWGDLFDGAIALAEDGFEVSPRMSESIARTAAFGPLDERPATRAYFFTEDGEPLPPGHVLKNPAYAQTLRALAQGGPGAFYRGEIAEAVIEAAREAPLGGTLSAADMESYAPRRAPAMCSPYRIWLVCSAPPPSSGGVMLAQVLALLEPFPLSDLGPDDPRAWHFLIEALRLSYADRDLYVADPHYADVPVEGLRDPAYLAQRAALIDPERAIAHAAPGTPPGAPARAADATDEAPGTTHFTIVDAWGDVVSMTSSIEAAFGSHRMAGGFLLNNQLTDFARGPASPDGAAHANAPEGGKRPRSSMSPVIVLERESGEFVLATGSPGGNSIPSYVAKSLAAMLDWNLTAQQAADLPNIVARGDTTQAEAGLSDAIVETLRDMGHEIVTTRGENSGIHIVRALPDGSLEGGADRRREGVARTP